MSFETQEYSQQDSSPIELFEIVTSNINYKYYYTSSSIAVVHLGNTYNPIPIKRKESISYNDDTNKDSLTIIVPATEAFAGQFIQGSPSYETTVNIYRMQGDGTYIFYWHGVVSSVAFDDLFRAEINCNSNLIKTTRSCLDRSYSTLCPLILFEAQCGASQSTFSLGGAIDSETGRDLFSTTFATKADGWLLGGHITINNEVRTIVYHVGNKIQVLSRFSEAVTGKSFAGVAGCDHSHATCQSKFSNGINFGGFPYIPLSKGLVKGKGFTY